MPSSKGLYSKQFVCDLFDFDTPELGFYFPIDIDQICLRFIWFWHTRTGLLFSNWYWSNLFVIYFILTHQNWVFIFQVILIKFVCDLFDFDTPELGFYFPIDIDQICLRFIWFWHTRTGLLFSNWYWSNLKGKTIFNWA